MVVAGCSPKASASDIPLNGPDGLWMASEGSHDVIVLDIMLPGMNGFKVCAVRNLLDNAASHANSAVNVVLKEADTAVRLVVSDDGPGVPADARERIFERFARLDDARSRDHGGTGLGLAIVREVIEAHGGTVTVDGPPGAAFTVILPLNGSADHTPGPTARPTDFRMD